MCFDSMNSHSCMIGSNSLKDLKSGVVKVCAGMFTRPHFQALRWLWLGSGTQSPLQNEKHDEKFQAFSDFHTQNAHTVLQWYQVG